MESVIASIVYILPAVILVCVIGLAIRLYFLIKEVKTLRADLLVDLTAMRDTYSSMWSQVYEASRAMLARIGQVAQETSKIDQKTQHLEHEIGRTKQHLNNSHRRYT